MPSAAEIPPASSAASPRARRPPGAAPRAGDVRAGDPPVRDVVGDHQQGGAGQAALLHAAGGYHLDVGQQPPPCSSRSASNTCAAPLIQARPLGVPLGPLVEADEHRFWHGHGTRPRPTHECTGYSSLPRGVGSAAPATRQRGSPSSATLVLVLLAGCPTPGPPGRPGQWRRSHQGFRLSSSRSGQRTSSPVSSSRTAAIRRSRRWLRSSPPSNARSAARTLGSAERAARLGGVALDPSLLVGHWLLSAVYGQRRRRQRPPSRGRRCSSL